MKEQPNSLTLLYFLLDIYKEFIDDEFDAKSYANTVIESHIIGDALAKLSTGIDLLNQELHKQVGMKPPFLFVLFYHTHTAFES